MLLFAWKGKMAWPMTDNDSAYRPPQMTRVNVSNETLLEIYRDYS